MERMGSSKTGRRAVGNLLRHYDRMQRTHPEEFPVIRLRTGGFQHKDDRVGFVRTPVLVVCGRSPKDIVQDILAGAEREKTSILGPVRDQLKAKFGR